jgi:hypothetical protein
MVEVRKESTGELIRIFRMNGNSVQVSLFHPGTFTVIIGEGENRKEFRGLATKTGENPEKIEVEM